MAPTCKESPSLPSPVGIGNDVLGGGVGKRRRDYFSLSDQPGELETALSFPEHGSNSTEHAP